MTTATAEPQTWNIYQKLAFRFFMVFFILYILLEPNGFIPNLDAVFNFYLTPMQQFIPWLAKSIAGINVEVAQTGSGDTTYDYCLYTFMAITAVAVMLIWSAIDRKTANYNKLFYWLCVFVRYYLALTMISYGMVKIIKLQFSSPSLGRLQEPVGNMSPMGLAWTYMGYSTGFNYFTGFAEFGCGLLLLFRKTTTLGAIVGLVVAGNIVAINYCFDVPVKLLSSMLVIMSLFLLFRDYTRLVNFFFKNADAKPSDLTPHRFRNKWKNITLTTVKYVFIIYILGANIYGDAQAAKEYGDTAKKPMFYGIYDVLSFVRNKDTIPPLTTDTSRWNKFTVDAYYVQLKYMNDSTRYLKVDPDTNKHTFLINTHADTAHKYLFHYIMKKDTLLLAGKWKNDSLHIKLKRFDEKKFRLFSRGFHWINEQAYNK